MCQSATSQSKKALAAWSHSMSTSEPSAWKTLGLGISATLLFIGYARAQDTTSGAAHASASAASPALGSWENTIKLSAQFEACIAGNPAGPSNGLNLGQLYTDKANKFELNSTTFATTPFRRTATVPRNTHLTPSTTISP
jgi:hypothetical protein